jgi:hypothetical protein
LLVQDSLGKSVRTGLPEKDSQYMTAWAIQAERDVRTELSGKDSQNRQDSQGKNQHTPRIFYY